MHTAGVICDGMTSTSTEQVSIATVYVITANISRDSTYKSYDSASNTSVVAILGAVGAPIIMIAIAVITFVLIARLRLKIKRLAQDKYNFGILVYFFYKYYDSLIAKQPCTSK